MRMRQFSRLGLCVALMAGALLCANLANAGVLTVIDRTGGASGDRDPYGIYDGNSLPLAMEAGGLINGNLVFSDRTYPWADTPTFMEGAEYIRTFNTDKDSAGAAVNYQVDLTSAATVFVTVDDRFGDPQGTVDNVVRDFAPAGTFVDTGWNLTIDEGGGRPLSLYVADLPAATYNFKEQQDNNFYTFGVVPGAIPEPPVPDRQLLSFTYSTVTGTGMISGTLDARGAGGPMEMHFEAPMPAPALVDPRSDLTPAGAVGTITEQTGSHNESGKTVGIRWSGMGPVTLEAMDGGKTYTVTAKLMFGPSGDGWSSGDDPNSSYEPFGENFDYQWEIDYSDDALEEHGGDAVTTGGGAKMAVFYGVGREEKLGLAHRLTQNNKTFDVGLDAARTNTDNTKDGKARYTKYAGYQDLALYFGWRQDDTLSDGSFQVDSMVFSGNLLVYTEDLVPEPATLGLLALGGLAVLIHRKRR